MSLFPGKPKMKLPAKLEKGGQMVMLGPDGQVQMELAEGGQRVFSREDTREYVNAAVKAKTDKHYLELGKRVVKALNKQDRNKKQYVTE